MGRTKFLLLMICCFPLASQELFILCEDSPPNQFRASNGELTGHGVELVREIQRRVGNQDPIRMTTWSGAYERIRTEANIVLFSMTRTRQRDKLFHWVGPIREASHGFWALSESNIDIHGLEDARRLPRIGVYKDDFRDQYLTNLGFTNLDRASRSDNNLKKLLEGHIPVVVNSKAVIQAQMAGLGKPLTRVKLLYNFMNVQLYLAFSSATDPKIPAQWNQALDSMRQDGTFARIYQKWFPDEPVPGLGKAPEY